jgi:hypothetical protein
MLGKLKSLDARLLRRRCVECGYDGALLRGGQATRCARCGCDLRRRPARSYAEMEGLTGQRVALHRLPSPTSTARETRGERLIYRWLAILFGALLLLIGIAYLGASAFTPW